MGNAPVVRRATEADAIAHLSTEAGYAAAADETQRCIGSGGQ